MRLIYRRLLLAFSCLIFFVVTPIIVLYAIGYRYSTGQPKPVSVGVILLTSLPSRAQVYVDNQLMGKTPRSVPNLLPGKVAVRIEKEGYRQWEKQVQVEAARAVTIDTIRLWPVAPPMTQLAGNVSLVEMSPDRKLLAVLDTTGQISVLDSDGQVVVPPVPPKSRPESMTWSPDSSALLLHAGSRWHVLPVASLGTPTALPTLSTAVSVVWDPRAPGRLLALTADHLLIASHTNNPAVEKLAQNIASFVVGSRSIYALTVAGELQQLNLAGEVMRPLPAITDHAIRTMYVSGKDTVAVAADNNSLWLLDQEDSWRQISAYAADAAWSPSGRVLLLHTASNELSVYTDSDQFQYLPPRQAQLITRLSRPISHINWFASDTHILYQVEDQIVVGEIDTRDYAVQTTLDTTNTGNAMVSVGADNETIYYIKKSGQQALLMKADLLLAE